MQAMVSAGDSGRQATPVVARSGRGWLKRVGDVSVLKVAGSDYEMGRQHGALLSAEVADGPVPYFRTVVEKLVGPGALGPAGRLTWPLLQQTVGRRVAKQIPEHVRATVEGIADGAGLDRQSMLDGCTMPDSLMWVAARMMKLRGHGPAVAHRLALGLEMGCTSAIAWGDATTDGAMLHARNFDYHGVGCWAGNKALIFHEPDDGQRYVSMAAAGIGLGGVTAMNAAGLTLTVHQHMFTDRTRLGGLPIGIAGDLVMRHATNLDEAQEILEAHRPIGCWTYVMTDGKRRETLLFEENPERRVAHRTRQQSGTLGYANIYLDRELGETEINLYGSYWRHNEGRHRRTEALLEENAGSLDPLGMANILGDVGSTDCRVRDSIAMVMTVGSVVFRPEDGMVWVGTGEAPTSHGVFEPFSLVTEDHAPEYGALPVGGPESAPDRRAFEHFRTAYISYTDEHAINDARSAMGAACELAPTQTLYWFLAGLLALNGGDAGGAEAHFDQSIALGHPDAERVAAFHLWRGRARDVLGRRDGAREDYRACLGHYADPPVHKAAKRGLRSAYTKKAAARFHIDVGLTDVVSP
ncbi:MAG: C45 family autoproteolytic acyltransferase/hydrolase [Sandaracinaceae bacterium]